MMGESPLEVKVWGDLACFTRPEMKVERVSYEVMTPAAARGFLEAIFWKPEFAWQIREIWVLNPIRHFAFIRNEIDDLQGAKSEAMKGGHFLAEEHRAQRYTLALRDVAYVIKADMKLKEHATDPPAKYRDQFRRRVKKGQYFHCPYLGTREFVASFRELDGSEQPVSLSDDLGIMLFDQEAQEVEGGTVQYWFHSSEGAQLVHGSFTPKFFHAKLDQGILRVPTELYEE